MNYVENLTSRKNVDCRLIIDNISFVEIKHLSDKYF